LVSFFFSSRRRDTRFSRDWSSDVCSSDLNTQLGYISLNQRLSGDEILGVSYQYTYNGQVYQVGEFANDGINATEFTETNGRVTRSEERRVGKECRSREWAEREK